MPLELVRVTLNWTRLTDGILARIFVPRNVRATIRYCKAVNVLQEDITVDHVESLLLTRVSTTATATPGIGNTDLFNRLRPILADYAGYPVTGTPVNAFPSQIKCEFERTFAESLTDLEVLVTGISILNKGPASNNLQGWFIINSSFDATVDALGFVIMEMIFEWPRNRPMVFAPEHVANEENQ